MGDRTAGRIRRSTAQGAAHAASILTTARAIVESAARAEIPTVRLVGRAAREGVAVPRNSPSAVISGVLVAYRGQRAPVTAVKAPRMSAPLRKVFTQTGSEFACANETHSDFSLSIVTVTFTSTELAVSYITSTSTRMTLSTSITINTQISTTTVTGGTTTIFSTSTTYVPPDGDVNKRTHIALEQLGEVVTAEPATSSSLSSPGNEVEVEEDVYLLAQAPLERRALKARQDVTSTFTESSWDWFTTFATSTTSTTVTSTNTVTSTSNSLSWSTYNVNPDFTEIGLVVVTETGTDPELTDDDGGGLSEGAKAGIGVGAAIGGVALLGAIAAIFFMKKRRRDQAGESDANHKPQAAISGGPGWKPSIQPSPVGNDVPPLMSQQQPAGSTWPGIGAAASAAAVGTTTGMYPTGTPNNNNHNKNSPGDRPSSIQPSNFHTEGSYSSGSPVLLHSPGSTQSPGAATHHYSQAMPTAPYGPVYASVTPPTDNGNRTWSSAAASSNAPPPPPPQHQGMVTESSHVNITQPVINVSSSSSSPPLRNSGTVHEMGSDHMTWAAGPAHATYEMPAAGPEAQQQAWENRGTGEYVPGQGVAEWGQQHHQHQHQHHHEWEHGPQSFAGPQEQR